ncbi:acyl carrier protein [Flavobacterium lacus]|uniref:Uncharacterized protein n=1 Tax=Flavobacterium lacus TaxID=1353778 RepID=A0A328WRI7_9FLAO|nr:hypothetical protein [Flavobacterium lacus]RAR46454.1 hypothetical protein B0I10_11913 [Flavobacterium lacus]
MKTKLLLLLLLIFSNVCIAQNILMSPKYKYLKDIKLDENKDSLLFNDKMLNILFANKVGTAFGGSNDLSLQKFYASLDANDKSLSIGANFDIRCGNETKKLSWVFSAGAKIKSKDNFATVYKDGDFQENNIGATFKISRIFSGNINFTSSNKKNRKKAILANRELLFTKYKDKVDKFNKDDLDKIVKKYNSLKNFDSDLAIIDTILKQKHDELYIELAKEEIDYLEKNKMYRFVSDKWLSLEVFVPFGENIYKTTNDVANIPLSNKNFYAFNATLSGNYMREYSWGCSIFFKSRLNLKNNNNVIVDNLTTTPFQSVTTGVNGIVVVTETNDGYTTSFKQFLTPSLTIEPAFFILNNTIGISPAVEFNAGEYKKTNWKLGIPISLKDKDKKPKINFEIQWKEVHTFNSNVHLVGLSANFLFGELIN